MTDRAALIRRIAGAIARKTASAAPAAVLAEIETTHVLVEKEEYADQHDELAEIVGAANRVVSDWIANDDFASFEQSLDELRRALVDWDLLGAYPLDPIRHVAAKADTSETMTPPANG